jgi:hypothetical protein
MKKLLLKSMLLLCALIVGSQCGWADTATITFKSQASGTSDGSTAYTTSNFVSNGIASSDAAFGTITCSATSKCYSGKTGYGMKAGASSNAGSFTITFSTALTNVSKITLNRASYAADKSTTITVKNGNTTLGSANTPANTDFSDMDITNLSIASLSSLTVQTGKYCYIKSITITYTGNTTVQTPTFSPVAGTYTSAQDITISCGTVGATIHYTVDGTKPTSESTTYESAINVAESKTIKAIAVKDGMIDSEIATATYTILSQKTITQARAQATGAVWTRGVVTSVSGKTAYIQDANAAIAVYNSAANLTVEKGDDVTVVGTLNTSHGLLRIESPEITVNSQGNAVSSAVKTIAEINIDNYADKALQGMLVKIENADVTVIDGVTVTIAQATNTLNVYGIAYGDVKVGDKITLVGNVGNYDAVQLVHPTDIVFENPTITLNKNSFSFDETGGDESITVTYNKMNATTLDILTYESNGTTPATYDWLTTNFNASNNVEFSVAANTGSARTAYFKIYGKGNDNSDIYSELITVTQAAYTTPATLPFAWAGGHINAFKALDGVTINGIDNEYGDSHDPYFMKLDNTGDYILIKTNGQPGKVAIGVKMIGGSNTSKIKVQESTNGIEFTDVETLTISGAQSSTHTLYTTKAFATTTRVIKLLFTKGSNVGVGPISIALPEPSTPDVDDDAHTVTLTTTANMAGWRTFAPIKANQNYTVDGTTKVYYASATAGGKVTLAEIAEGVPANTPVILHQTSGTTITLTETATSITAPGSNLLQVSTAGQNLGTVYRLGFKSTHGIGFYTYTTNSAPAGIIYLSSINAAREFLDFDFDDNETTGVNEVKSPNVAGEFFDLSGRKVVQPTKGLYIVNGKKVVIK